MQRLVERLPRVLDLGVVVLACLLFEIPNWFPSNPVGDPVAGPRWLVDLLPLLCAVPLYWRRRHPLLVWGAFWSGIGVQAVVTSNTPEGLELIYTMAVGAYSVARFGTRRTAWAGLATGLAGYCLYSAENHDIRSGRASELWAGAFFAVGLVAFWMFGAIVREHRDRMAAAARARAWEREAQRAVTEERSRLARELHDIVAHNLSVVVVQAAGARARAGSDADTLEKIERSGRESLVEMRRLLGVLRAEREEVDLEPQPGISTISLLVEQVREAGVDIVLSMTGSTEALPAAVDLSAYRIVQEALTNVLKHAGPATVHVDICQGPLMVEIRVTDDGCGVSPGRAGPAGPAGHGPPEPGPVGHGLLGMRERVALFGGDLETGPRADGRGFSVRARLPVVASP